MWLELTIIFILSYYLYLKLSCGKTKSPVCLLGKTAIVTGGNSGIGYQVCLNLASRGCKVIIADKDDSEKSRRKIIEATANHCIVSKFLDLSSFKSIRRFAEDINQSETKLDILVNNAGVATSKNESTEDGLHSIMQINYFGPFLLTHLLLDLLKKSAPSRIVFTSSILAFLGTTNLEIIQFPNKNRSWSSPYSNSKLAILMTSDMFADKLKGTGVTSNSVHPGYVRTKIFHQLKYYPSQWLKMRILIVFGYIIGKDVWEGAQTTTHVAISKKLENVTGGYFWDCRSFPRPLQAGNKDQTKKLWALSEECVRLEPHERI